MQTGAYELAPGEDHTALGRASLEIVEDQIPRPSAANCFRCRSAPGNSSSSIAARSTRANPISDR